MAAFVLLTSGGFAASLVFAKAFVLAGFADPESGGAAVCLRLNSERIDFLGVVTCSVLVLAASAPEPLADLAVLVDEAVDELVTAVDAVAFLFPNKDLEGAGAV